MFIILYNFYFVSSSFSSASFLSSFLPSVFIVVSSHFQFPSQQFIINSHSLFCLCFFIFPFIFISLTLPSLSLLCIIFYFLHIFFNSFLLPSILFCLLGFISIFFPSRPNILPFHYFFQQIPHYHVILYLISIFPCPVVFSSFLALPSFFLLLSLLSSSPPSS